MKRYVFPEEKRSALESLRQPFAIYQFIDKRVVTLLLSDGFCDLFGYKDDRASAIYDMDNDMYRNDHPDDVARIADDAVRFATEGGTYDVVYRTKIRGTSDYMIVHAKGEHVYMEDGTRLAQVWYTDEGIYVEGAAESGFEITRTLSNALHEQSIVRTARYDDLTGLPNMSYFFELAEAWEKSDSGKGRPSGAALYRFQRHEILQLEVRLCGRQQNAEVFREAACRIVQQRKQLPHRSRSFCGDSGRRWN